MKALLTPFKLVKEIFTETDGNGGKMSFSRVFGAYVIYEISTMARTGAPIDEAMVTMFWVLVGYQLLSKALNSMSPAVLNIAQGYMLKAGAKLDVQNPKPQP